MADQALSLDFGKISHDPTNQQIKLQIAFLKSIKKKVTSLVKNK